MRHLFLAVAVVVAAHPASAQIPVIDTANLAQAVTIAERTLREYEALQAQYRTLQRMSQGLGGLDRYRLSPPRPTTHDTTRAEYGRPWLQGLNSGDPTGAAYTEVVRRKESPGFALDRLPPTARRVIENAYATVDVTDALARLGGHQVGRARQDDAELRRAIEALQADVVNPAAAHHEMTAILDKVAAGALIGRRQDAAGNQLLSHALEQLLIRGKRLRDAEAAALNMRLGALRDGRVAGSSLVRGAADDLKRWRQP